MREREREREERRAGIEGDFQVSNGKQLKCAGAWNIDDNANVDDAVCEIVRCECTN